MSLVNMVSRYVRLRARWALRGAAWALFLAGAAGLLSSCASSGTRSRVVIDASGARPDWVDSSRVRTEADDRVRIRGRHTVRGNERVSACLELAILDAQSELMRGIASDFRVRIEEATQGVSEAAEQVLSQTRVSESRGQLRGFRRSEEYTERYLAGDQERIDCYVLAELSSADFASLKRSLGERVIAADPRVKEAILQNQVDFLQD